MDKKVFGSLFLAMAMGLQAESKVSKDLAKEADDKDVAVIVQYAAPPSASDKDKVAKAGGTVATGLSSIDGLLVKVKAKAARSLASDPNVKFMSLDRAVTANDIYTNEATGATAAQALGWTGANIGIAVIDSGTSSTADFGKRLAYSQSFVTEPADERYGHGSHVAGIATGAGGTYKGVAMNAKIISLRVLNDQGTGTDSSVIAAIDRAIALKSQYKIRVINLSLGRAVQESYTLDPLCQAVERAWKAGIVVVVAAGNFGRYEATAGYATIGSPGIDPFVITVGGMKSMQTLGRGDDKIASYSSKGPTLIDHIIKPDLVAPGNIVVSVSAKGTSVLDAAIPQNKVGADYLILSGTSMAAPVVSGAAALLLEKTPSLTPNQVKAVSCE
jgi:serine protease AprX